MSEEMQGRSRRKKEGEDQPFSLKKEIISWLQIIVAAVVIALVLNNFVIANSRVPTGSMENTIMSRSRVIGSRLAYLKGKIRMKRSDDGRIYAVKTMKLVDEEGARQISEKKEEAKKKRVEKTKHRKQKTNMKMRGSD